MNLFCSAARRGYFLATAETETRLWTDDECKWMKVYAGRLCGSSPAFSDLNRVLTQRQPSTVVFQCTALPNESFDWSLNSETTAPMCEYNTEICNWCHLFCNNNYNSWYYFYKILCTIYIKQFFVTKLVNASIIGTFITANRDITVHCELPLH